MQHRPISTADAQPVSRTVAPGLRSDIYTLRGGGEVVLTLPDVLSQRDYDDLQDWLDLMGRKAKRSVSSAAPASPPAPEPEGAEAQVEVDKDEGL